MKHYNSVQVRIQAAKSAGEGAETACPIENFVRLSLHHRRRKRLVQPTIQCFQRFPATLFLYGCTICRQILGQVGDNVARNLHGGGGPGVAGGKLGIDAGGVVYKIRVESGRFNLLLIQVARKLMNQRPDHL